MPTIFVALVVIGVVPSIRGAENTPLQLGDIYRGDLATYLTLSPDAQSAVYCRQWIDPDEQSYRYSLWLVEGQAENRRQRPPAPPTSRGHLA